MSGIWVTIFSVLMGGGGVYPKKEVTQGPPPSLYNFACHVVICHFFHLPTAS